MAEDAPALAHIGIATAELDRAEAMLAALGASLEGREVVASEGVEVSFVRLGDVPLEFLRPLDPDAEGGVAGFLRRRGPGVHHVALGTKDLAALLAQLKAAGVEPVGGGARPGAGGRPVAFLHPRDTGGLLIELCEVSA